MYSLVSKTILSAKDIIEEYFKCKKSTNKKLGSCLKKTPRTVLSRVWLAVHEKMRQGNLEFYILDYDIVPRISIIHTMDI